MGWLKNFWSRNSSYTTVAKNAKDDQWLKDGYAACLSHVAKIRAEDLAAKNLQDSVPWGEDTHELRGGYRGRILRQYKVKRTFIMNTKKIVKDVLTDSASNLLNRPSIECISDYVAIALDKSNHENANGLKQTIENAITAYSALYPVDARKIAQAVFCALFGEEEKLSPQDTEKDIVSQVENLLSGITLTPTQAARLNNFIGMTTHLNMLDDDDPSREVGEGVNSGIVKRTYWEYKTVNNVDPTHEEWLNTFMGDKGWELSGSPFMYKGHLYYIFKRPKGGQ